MRPFLTSLLLLCALCCHAAPKAGTALQADALTEDSALAFLYAYMPLADATDYTRDFHLANVRAAFRARRLTAWGDSVPVALFRHFVLPQRVNNEPLDSFRLQRQDELLARVKGLSMKDAILEVNHWCHEHVTYEPSDARTSSPLQTIRTAKGRCGEESTLAVAALRTVGIPARQVYTPRWAHTDDNHAWVEAWADGRWWFIGACEPEPVLNLAWFNAPASRAMLTHTRAFGDYRGSEEVVLRAPGFTELNLIANYADTASTDFIVRGTDGKPVEGARVEFKIYNYGEYYSAVTKYTDHAGRTFLSAGLGDLVVWASKNGRYGYRKVSFGRDHLVAITLDHDAATAPYAEDIDITPPAGHPQMPTVTARQRADNDRRFAREDSMREAYTATFQTAEKLAGYKYQDAVPYIVKSRGNWRVIKAFLDRYATRHERAMKLLATLSDKDLRDIPAIILEDNMEAATDQLSPRVEDEPVFRPFKRFFEQNVPDSLQRQWRADPATLVQWVARNIKPNPDSLALDIAQTPLSVWQCRTASARSRDIFFVDLARSIGIPASKDPVTGKVLYGKDGQTANFDATVQAPAAKTGTLVMTYTPSTTLADPKYYYHFTISRIVDGRARLLSYDEGNGGDGASWANTFAKGACLDPGTYLLTSGQRMASGAVLAHNVFFRVQAGDTTVVPLVMRDSQEGVKVIGSFSSESRFTRDGKQVSIVSQAGRGYYALGVLEPGKEPTDHALRDIAKARESLDRWGRPLVLLFPSQADADKFAAHDYGQMPRNLIIGVDEGGAIQRALAANPAVNTPASGTAPLPFFIIADTFDRIVFSSKGYTIGLGERLGRVAAKLDE